jgi:hypothetical protein
VCAERSRGQGTIEWIGLLAVAALLIVALALAAGTRLPGVALARAVAERLVCAVRLTENCRNDPALEAAHGDELAALLQAHAPTLFYEEGMTALPVDYRACREDGCAAGDGAGVVSRSLRGEPVVAFTHVVDCRPRAAAASGQAGADCSGPRAGNVYLQYWFYYPGSATAEGSTPLKRPIRKVSTALGRPSYHPDDWESYQVRIGPAGRFSRASSHHDHTYQPGGQGLRAYELRRGPGGRWALRRRPELLNGWGPETGTLYVSGGSHAGRARSPRDIPRATKDHRLRLISIASLGDRDAVSFAVTPPWRKRVYQDPEYGGTE